MNNLNNIPKDMQEDFIASFWAMLRECETTADNNNDPILKHMVSGYYRQWNKVADDNKEPCWISRSKQK
jgi:hypothetical protein